MQTAEAFITNPNVLTVVAAYLNAVKQVPMEKQITLMQGVLEQFSAYDASRIFDIPLARIYDYRRPDWLVRRSHKRPSSVFIEDFVKIVGGSIS